MFHTELKPFREEKDFLWNSQTSALACFREPVCSVMLFWPVDTSSSATTKGDSFEGWRETAFKQHILNVFFCCFHLLCCLSFEFVSRPRATALTRLPAMVCGHTVFATLSLQLRGQKHSVNTPVTITARSCLNLRSTESCFFRDVQQISLEHSVKNLGCLYGCIKRKN